jgi:MFS family permease
VKALLRLPAFRGFLISAVLARLGGSSLGVLLGYHVYQLTHDPMMIGWLGLAQATPAVTLVLYGGHLADRFSRRTMALLGRCGWIAGSGLLAIGAAAGTSWMVPVLLVGGFALACAGAITNPAMAGLEAEVVPRESTMRAVSLLGSASQASALAGPLAGALLFEAAGPSMTYGVICALFCGATLVMVALVPDSPAPPRSAHTNAFGRIAEGFRIVIADQRLIGSMALDLFAVFFGGASALLPIFATEILHVGAGGFGLLRAAESIGALAAMLVATRHPPRHRAGLALFIAIAGFGVAIITFALSQNFVLSFVALLAVGVCDGVSMVVRQAILRLVAPGAMRGRISAVRSVFINASNELGDVESGMLAAWIGAVPTVWLGGVITLGVVAVTAWRAPDLRRMNLAAMESTVAAG